MRPDRIIVGEVRAGEALDMLQAMNTGHEGSLATVHANSVNDALYRLETLASMSDVDVPFRALHEQVNEAIDVVCQLQRGSDGTRRITEVAAVVSQRDEPFRTASLMTWEPDLTIADGKHGSFRTHPLPTELVNRLRGKGEHLAGASDVAGGDLDLLTPWAEADR
jgi:pilus assembly protein CpaF